MAGLMACMETAVKILSVAKQIYDVVDQVKSFKNRSRSLKQRIQTMAPAIERLASGKNDDVVGSTARDEKGIKIFSGALGELLKLLSKIQAFLDSLKEKSFISQLFRIKEIGSRFDEYSGQLSALFNVVHFGITEEMREVTYDRIKQDKENQKKDEEDFLALYEKLGSLEKGQHDIKQQLEEIKKGLVQPGGNDPKPSLFDHRQPIEGVRHINRNDLEKTEKLSVMRFGEVFEAKFMKETVALKIFRKGVPLDKKLFEREAKNLMYLDSKNVVRIWGVCIEVEPYIIVLEYMERGNLRYVLDETEVLPYQRRIEMALGGALGLYRIHHMPHPMLHRDLSSTKFLVNANWEVKISDVGFAQTRSSMLKKAPGDSSKSSLQYICPERFRDVNMYPDHATEVYSYGIIMWEIATGKVPYEGYTNEEIMDFVSTEKRKLPFDTTVVPNDERFKNLIYRCLDFQPLVRPNSSEIVDTLQNLKDSYLGY